MSPNPNLSGKRPRSDVGNANSLNPSGKNARSNSGGSKVSSQNNGLNNEGRSGGTKSKTTFFFKGKIRHIYISISEYMYIHYIFIHDQSDTEHRLRRIDNN